MPKQFLVHILLQLKQKGILVSARGVGGGYRLAKSPSEITVADVVRAVEPTLTSPETKSNSSLELSEGNALFNALWKNVEREAIAVIERVTFDELAERVNGSPEYVI